MTEQVQDHMAKGDWVWNSQTSVPPGSKQLRSNTGGWDVVASINMTTIDNNDVDRTAQLVMLKVGDVIRLEHFTDNARWATFTVAASPVNNSGYFSISVTTLAQGGTLPNSGTQIAVSATPLLQPDKPVTPSPGYMALMIEMQPSITTEIADDLMEYLCDYLVTVTHLVNHVELSANVGGVIITDGEDILPASVGDLVPPPAT